MRTSRFGRATAALGAGSVTLTLAAAGVAVAGHTGAVAHRVPAAPRTATPSPAAGVVAAPARTVARRTSQSAGSAAVRLHPAAPAGATPAVARVPRLHHLTPPDAVVTVRHAISLRQITQLRHRSGVHHVAALDRGTVTLPTGRLHVVGVPLSTIRGFTPKVTAASLPLWHSVARGELTVSFSDAKHRLRHRLGDTLPARVGRGTRVPLRIGAFATLDLAGAQAMVAQQRSPSLRLARRRELLVAAPAISLDQLRVDIHRTIGHAARVHITRPEPVNQSVLSSYARTAIPSSYLDLYRRAALTCPGLPWTVLAGIGTVETGNGSNVHRSTAGALGPMQFMPSTWAMYGIDADGNGKADINDPVDAVFSAARYLCAAGAGRGTDSINNAIFSYNHAWWYVREVLVLANRYS